MVCFLVVRAVVAALSWRLKTDDMPRKSARGPTRSATS